jgi:glycolate oxidase FAD binding subunit
VGLLRVELQGADSLWKLLDMRAEVNKWGGSVVVLHCPAEIRQHVEAWGYAGDALGLMRRMKQQFDPDGTLNPGRFVGGI